MHLLQISDPHFGKLFSNTRASWLHPGLNCHDFRLCEALHQLIHEDLGDLPDISDDDELFLVMNGDLTSKGHEREFEVANTFLFAEQAIVHQGRRQEVGLRQPLQSPTGKDLYAGIPGNHDHANGMWPWPFVRGHSPRIYGRFLDPTPFIKQTWYSDGLELCVFGIDSCSIYEEMLLNFAPDASGGFSKRHREQFQAFVESELSKPLIEGCRFRTAAIVCHHPCSADGGAGPLCPFCVRWLHDLALRYGIRIMLTGHTHRTWTQTIKLNGAGESEPGLREVRCPTTLQTPAKLDAESQSPGLWWHKIRVIDEEIVWEGTLLLYSGSSFIIPEQQQTDRRGPTPQNEPQREIWFRETMPSISPRRT